ncbi:YbhB/YbcL family Raf kinase inhibitor-like protein [Bifidobacterium sp. 82T24]|uniref:YbhB/YbcL family Raf kinase inhibitor-like protein n=1 Tax=Bifidobacterium pluvialisilvae TaxID=2834436 RepID=UPI001C581560|nr:YbhB/YbcL family Raf kinase inhibitor-like protein [Bifidobacterium pluvialisilvae]MBW3088273.1 YbhB/YbcL family Raf kinase inhibitor-like protein [Bifidobacterium pluvialisilvae]
MKISADFTTIPDVFAKHTDPEYQAAGVPVVSFPFYVDDVAPDAQYLHWTFTDPDSIPVCGFEWIHWTVANLPIAALMYDFNDSHALQIPPDFSRQMVAMIPEALQGRTSQASPFVGGTDPAATMRYNGPQPPDKDHDYYLHVYATKKPLPGLSGGFWMNELVHALRNANAAGDVPDQDAIFLTGKA